MRFLLLITFFWIGNTSIFSQTVSEQSLIDQQVWIPFMESYSNFEGEKFIALHSEKMIRVGQNNNEIRTIEDYAVGIREWWPKQILKGEKRKLELRFTQRIATEIDAFEVGIYKVSYLKEGGSTENHYGQFHVVLKKENGIWKITVDADSNHEKTISEEDFLKGQGVNN